MRYQRRSDCGRTWISTGGQMTQTVTVHALWPLLRLATNSTHHGPSSSFNNASREMRAVEPFYLGLKRVDKVQHMLHKQPLSGRLAQQMIRTITVILMRLGFHVWKQNNELTMKLQATLARRDAWLGQIHLVMKRNRKDLATRSRFLVYEISLELSYLTLQYQVKCLPVLAYTTICRTRHRHWLAGLHWSRRSTGTVHCRSILYAIALYIYCTKQEKMRLQKLVIRTGRQLIASASCRTWSKSCLERVSTNSIQVN